MTLLLRAIVRTDDAARAADASLVTSTAGAVAAVASPHEGAHTADTAALLEHHRVVAVIFERVPCLPARFGAVFADARMLGIQLAKREAELAAALERVGPRCELSLTLAWNEEGDSVRTTSLASGTAYMRRGLARLELQRSRTARATEIVGRLLAALPLDQAFIRAETCPREAVAASVALLVLRDEIGTVRSRTEQVAATLPDITMSIQGPWPPYSFAVSA